MTERPPRDNIVRALFPGGEMRTDTDGATPRLVGHFARFNEWTLIDSAMEGRFYERIAPGAFAKTFAEHTPKMLFQHGMDPQVGDKPIGVPRSLVEDDIGPAFDADILDGLPPLILAGLRAEPPVYGVSYRFSVPGGKDDWNERPARSVLNPDGIPERTIREAKVFEFGPVTFPADPGARIAVRSLTDEYTFNTLTADPVRLRALVDDALPPTEPTTVTPTEEPPPVPAAEPPDEPASNPPDPEERTVEYTSRDDKAARLAELRDAITRRATEYPGVFPDDVQAMDDADNREHDDLERDIKAWDARQARIIVLSGDPARTESTYSPPTVIRTKPVEDIYDVRAVDVSPRSPEERALALRDNAMRSIESSYLPTSAKVDALVHFIDVESRDDEDREQEATRRILLTGSPAYKRAFAKYLRNGNERAWTPEESRAAALAVVGTTTTGGYAVPYVFDPTFINIGVHTSINPYRAACHVETISGGNNWRAVTATAIVAKWDTEAAASVEGGPTIGQPTFTVQRADGFATVSIETLQDRPDVTEELSRLFGEAKDTLEENSYTLGVGTTVYPFGMFRTLAFTATNTATNDVTAIADTTAVEAALPLRHRMNAAWFMSRSTQRQLEALDTTGYYFKRVGQFFAAGSPIPLTVPTGNTGTQLLGYPVWEVPSAVSTLTTDGAIIAVFGDPRNYVIVDRIGMNVEVVPTMLNGATPSFPTGQRGIYCYWRATARPINVDGMRQLTVQ